MVSNLAAYTGQRMCFWKGRVFMTSFEYTITTPVDIHTRHAGLLIRTAKALDGGNEETNAGTTEWLFKNNL